ncbi:hypothetical protein EJ03DRAFT_301772 [Teratosphaeria nubilosa]|uniref:Uncharacterized protein n=1 Tax=Teratosphaeria nubilosa TaxID=161662 RepID=A0A6G1KW23_9PEZI|nr:hypothetical protein EJ03DRAFT_301772 [Teratosphaeria nubilosa]
MTQGSNGLEERATQATAPAITLPAQPTSPKSTTTRPDQRRKRSRQPNATLEPTSKNEANRSIARRQGNRLDLTINH